MITFTGSGNGNAVAFGGLGRTVFISNVYIFHNGEEQSSYCPELKYRKACVDNMSNGTGDSSAIRTITTTLG